MTAEQLEELLGKVTPDWCVYSEPEVGLEPSLFAGRVGGLGFGPIEPLQGYDLMLAALAPSLALRVIAAEKLVEEVDIYLTGNTGHRDLARAVTAYRVASK